MESHHSRHIIERWIASEQLVAALAGQRNRYAMFLDDF